MTETSESRWWAKWDRVAKSYDFMTRGVEFRFGEEKRCCFSRSAGKTLLVAVGTGLDLQYFPGGHEIVGIDISSAMLEKARKRLATDGIKNQLVRADVQLLGFRDGVFDSVVTSCTL